MFLLICYLGILRNALEYHFESFLDTWRSWKQVGTLVDFGTLPGTTQDQVTRSRLNICPRALLTVPKHQLADPSTAIRQNTRLVNRQLGTG